MAAKRDTAEPSARQALDPLVLALDIGSSASRVRVYDATGAPVRDTRGRLNHAIEARADGGAELDPDAIAGEVERLIDGVLAAGNLRGRIGGVALDTIAPTLIGVDVDGAPLTPCYTYADGRAAAEAERLRGELDEDAVQRRTGCRFHPSYLPARLRWLRAADGERFGRVERWLSLGEYVWLRLLGTTAAGVSTAAWSGLLDRHTGAWDGPLLAACGVRPEQLAPVRELTAPLPPAGGRVAERWPALAGAVWFPPQADGWASTVGSGGAAALAAGTSGALRAVVHGTPAAVPRGLWCYRVAADRSLVGGAINDAGRFVDWLRATLRLPEPEAQDAHLRLPPAAALPAVLPFLTGERNPGWAAEARAAFAGIGATTAPLDLFRAALEGVALRYRLIGEELARAAPSTGPLIASGGVADELPGWLQIAADALGRPVVRSDQRQATLRGTALLALDVLAPTTPRIPPAFAETYTPHPDRRAYYAHAAAQQASLYERVTGDE